MGRDESRESVAEQRRGRILDAMRDLLETEAWSGISLADVARQSGLSRQTVYNEFGSRAGLTLGYAVRLAGDIVAEQVEAAIHRNVGDAHAAFVEGFESFFVAAAADPFVRSLLGEDQRPELLRFLGAEGAGLADAAAQRLGAAYQRGWVDGSEEEAMVLARAVVRMCLSYLALPPEPGRDIAADLASVFAPYADVVAARSAARSSAT